MSNSRFHCEMWITDEVYVTTDPPVMGGLDHHWIEIKNDKVTMTIWAKPKNMVAFAEKIMEQAKKAVTLYESKNLDSPRLNRLAQAYAEKYGDADQ